jgi:hypothetical protein
MLLVATLRTRFHLPRGVLAELFGTSTGTLTKAEQQITPLLDQRKHTIEPAETTFTTLAELTAFAAFAAFAAANGVTLTQASNPRVNHRQTLSRF